jgi:hypothetical protein
MRWTVDALAALLLLAAIGCGSSDSPEMPSGGHDG